MTAFARESGANDQGALTVELRSVNHRYLDCSFKIPGPLRHLEPRLRDIASTALARGKLECTIRLQDQSATTETLQVNPDRLDQLLAATELISRRLGDMRPPSALEILQFPGVCATPDKSDEQLQQLALKLFRQSIDNLSENRRREGDKLATLVRERLLQVDLAVVAAREKLPALLQQQHDRINRRLQELEIEIDHSRLEQELVYLAQKADVDEELDRLEAHVSEVRRTLEKGGPCGRRLDFLMQELNREANTLSSKSINSSSSQNAVDLKVLIEQMREQIQNIE